MSRDSEKPIVFSHLFNSVYDPDSGDVRDSTVTQQHIQEAIMLLQQEEGISLQVGNPANFLKDFLRSHSRNAWWPQEIAQAGFTARQSYGESRVFDFVPYTEGQTVPFPDEFLLPGTAPIHPIEAVSLPSAARALGRGDEAWLIQVCVNQRILQTHFALFSDIDVVDLFHLQNSLKGRPEIDAVFLLVFNAGGEQKKALMTLEAKRKDPILPYQIKGQVALMAKQSRKRVDLSDIEFIVPIATSVIRRGGETIIAIFEMAPISVADGVAAYDQRTSHDLPLVIAKSVGYALSPKVSGI